MASPVECSVSGFSCFSCGRNANANPPLGQGGSERRRSAWCLRSEKGTTFKIGHARWMGVQQTKGWGGALGRGHDIGKDQEGRRHLTWSGSTQRHSRGRSSDGGPAMMAREVGAYGQPWGPLQRKATLGPERWKCQGRGCRLGQKVSEQGRREVRSLGSTGKLMPSPKLRVARWCSLQQGAPSAIDPDIRPVDATAALVTLGHLCE